MYPCDCPDYAPCHDCIVEYVKDWEDGEAIYYNDEYTGPFGTSSYNDWN